MTGVASYGLTPPAKILTPRIRCAGQPCDTVTVVLGAGFGADDPARAVRKDYGTCPEGCCRPGTMVSLRVPCDSLPHCQSCECGSEHEFLLTPEQVTELKGILP